MTNSIHIAAERERPARVNHSKGLAAFGYTSLAAILTIGWLLRDQLLVNPEDGLGYWLGIAGGSMMLLLLIYPMRKRIRALRFLGPTKHWFRFHMMLGLGGPMLVLYHCNFQVHSFNSTVALYSMLLVAGSGIVGRYFYARIHRGLYGQKLSLQELQQDLAVSLEKSQGVASLMPQMVAELERLSAELQGDQITRSIGTRRSLAWTIKPYYLRWSLYFLAVRELKVKMQTSDAVARDYKNLKRNAGKFVSGYIKLLRGVAQFTFYERLFSLWHVFHLPIFMMMVLAVSVHILAVHMY